MFNLKLIGLSIDKNFNKWKSYINKEKIPWQTFVLEKGMHNPIIKLLGFEGVPHCLLSDSNGVIIKEHTTYAYVLQ